MAKDRVHYHYLLHYFHHNYHNDYHVYCYTFTCMSIVSVIKYTVSGLHLQSTVYKKYTCVNLPNNNIYVIQLRVYII